MSFVRPTLSELVTRVEADFVSRMELAGGVLRRAVVRVTARVFAGAVHMLHGHLDFLAKQMFADTAEAEFLARIAGLYGIVRNAAEYAEGPIVITGTDDTVIPADTILTRSDGAEYATLAEVTITAGEATPTVRASEAGEDGDCDAGVELTFESPIDGATSPATVDSDAITGGADEETDEELRVRVLAHLSDPPQGGSNADYVEWAKEIAGVTRVWVYPEEDGVGTVAVRFVRDNDDDPIPASGEVEDVQEHLDELRPVTATVTAKAPVDTPLDMTLSVTPDTTATRAAVVSELEDMFLRDAEPGEPILLSHIQDAVGDATGVTDYEITVPAADVNHSTGELASLGTITWA